MGITKEISYYNLLINGLSDKQYRNRCAVANLIGDLLLDKKLSNGEINEVKSRLIHQLDKEITVAARSSIEKVLDNIKI